MINIDFIDGKGVISGDHFMEIREFFSIDNPAAKFARGFFVAKRLYAIGTNGKFNIGLLEEIQKFIIRKKYDTKFNISKEAKAELYPKLEKPLIQRLSKDLRYYQEDSLNKCLQIGRGVLLLGTGAGKTLTCAGLIDNFYLYAKDTKSFKCLIIVPGTGLASQTYREILEYNVSYSVTLWTGKDKPDFSANVIIANTEILQSRFAENKWLQDIDLLVVDECHKLTAKSELTKMVSKIKTPNKFGLTGTLPENNIDKWNVIGKMGPVIMEKSSSELREEKFLTNAKIKVFNLEYKTKPEKVANINPTDRYFAELEFIANNTFRNDVIKSISTNFKNNLLILVNNISHGENLFNLLSKIEGKQVFYIKGEVEVEDREEVKKVMEGNDNVVCIAISAIFSTGINIKNIHGIMFAAGGKSFIRTVQTIGRGLRLNENKENLLIIDLSDRLEYGIQHGKKRKEIYVKENIEFTDHTVKEK